MSLQTASFINLIYNSALLDQGVPSSKAHSLVPIILQKLPTSCETCSLAMSDTMASGAPTSFANCLMAERTSDLRFIGTTYMHPLSVTNNWQHVFPHDEVPPFFVAKKVSMKKYWFICLYWSIRSFVLKF